MLSKYPFPDGRASIHGQKFIVCSVQPKTSWKSTTCVKCLFLEGKYYILWAQKTNQAPEKSWMLALGPHMYVHYHIISLISPCWRFMHSPISLFVKYDFIKCHSFNVKSFIKVCIYCPYFVLSSLTFVCVRGSMNTPIFFQIF